MHNYILFARPSSTVVRSKSKGMWLKPKWITAGPSAPSTSAQCVTLSRANTLARAAGRLRQSMKPMLLVNERYTQRL
eukprot:6192297-Pleurochrysis_carterae.AAC.1